MKTSKRWLCVLATVLGCTAPAIGFANVETTEKAAEESPILQTAVSRWEDPAAPQAVPAVHRPSNNNTVIAPCAYRRLLRILLLARLSVDHRRRRNFLLAAIQPHVPAEYV